MEPNGSVESPTPIRYLPSVRHLSRKAFDLHQAYHAADPAAAERFEGAKQGYSEQANRQVFPGLYTRVEAAQVIARENGFEEWGALLNHKERPDDPQFEAAVEAVISGDSATLSRLLQANPTLVHAHSACKHNATLLHYVAANGVEDNRQKTPPNAPEIARILLEAGADPDELSCSYFGGNTQTPIYHLVSSCHPAERGVQGELVRILCEFAANPNGIDEDGLPLATALAFGYSDALNALIECGARTDNIVFAAAAGDAKKLESRLVPGQPLMRADAPRHASDTFTVSDDPKRAPEQALFYAAKFGRLDIVRLLIERGVDLNAPENEDRRPIHWAAFHGHLEVVRYLVEHGASAAFRDRRWHASPCGWAEEGKRQEVLDYLIGNGNLDLVDAAAYGVTGRVRELLHAGEAPNGPDGRGMPLRTAAYHGYADVVRILLSHGADRSLKSREGKNALDYAEAQGREEVAALLRNP